MSRLLHLVLALQSAYTLLSLTYESLFLLCLSGTLATWIEMERAESGVSSTTDKLALASDRPKNVVDWRDAFRALLFVFHAVVSFFGTGNIASLNSFDPSSIRCLVSVFNPFLMGGILLGKVLIPFLLVSVCFYLVKTVTRMHPRAFLLTMIVLADAMGLHFFFLVTDEGSWLDIGSSLSRFVIAEATAIFLSVLLVLAELLLSVKLGRRGPSAD